MTLDIIIINWNSSYQLRDCINSVLAHGAVFFNRIVIVDNGSSDDSIQLIENHGQLTIIRLQENLGFGKACNIGAADSKAEYLLFLNPDALLFSNSLGAALNYMKFPENSAVGICGIQLVDEHNKVSRSCTHFPTSGSFICHAIGIDRIFPKLGFTMRSWDHSSVQDVDHVIGAFYLVRRPVFDQLEGFDERFFVYLEDLDFSKRARSAGWRIAYLASVQAFHAGGGTSKQIMARRLFYSVRSRLLYAYKHLPWVGATFVLLATLGVEPLSRSVQAVGCASWSGFKETWSAYAMLWRWLPRWVWRGETT